MSPGVEEEAVAGATGGRRGSRATDARVNPRRHSVLPMSMTNEDHNAEWELGDAITIHLDPEEPETDDEAEDAARD